MIDTEINSAHRNNERISCGDAPSVCVTCCLMAVLLSATAPSAEADEFAYTTNDGATTVIGYTGAGGNVTIPSTNSDGLPVTCIGFLAFANFDSLTSVTVPDSVTNIGDGAFYYCTGLTNVTMSTNIVSIEAHAFGFCYSLTGIMIPNGVTSIGHEAFRYCASLTSIMIPNSVTYVGDCVFFQCTGLTNAIISTNLTRITFRAFSCCFSLTTVTIPVSVTNIGQRAFQDCVSLTGLSIPISVTGMGDYAFASCRSLTSVVIPSNTTSIADLAFADCVTLTNISVDAANAAYSSVNGVLFNKEQTSLIQFPSGRGDASYSISGGVTCIGIYAFGWCTNLTSVTIPGSVTNIGDTAFQRCTSLNGVYFKGNAPCVCTNAFADDPALTVYCLPGTTGWDTTLGDKPTVLWNPQVPGDDGTFGETTGGFGFTVSGATNMLVVVKACTNLSSPVWTSLATFSLANGASYFSDGQWTNHTSRFYGFSMP